MIKKIIYLIKEVIKIKLTKKEKKLEVNIKGLKLLVGNFIPLPWKNFEFSYLGSLYVDGIEYNKACLKSTVKLDPLPTERNLCLSRFEQKLTEEIPVFFVGTEYDFVDFIELKVIDFDDLKDVGLKGSEK